MKNILLAVSGASGAIYAKSFIEQINQIQSIYNDLNFYLIFTDTAKTVWEDEIGKLQLFLEKQTKVQLINNSNFSFKYASGSNTLDAMVILPCSMGTLGRIACGISHDLIGRIADVQLKERRTLVICPRETPYSAIHLKNMLSLTQNGAIIAPACPSFYHKAQTLDKLAQSFSSRIIEISKIAQLDNNYKWE